MTNQLSIDIESYSEVPLKTGGVYKYASHPSFDILLCAVSVNRQDPVCYDLTVPHERQTFIDTVVPILSQDGIIKKAANAEFEWVCLSVWLNRHGLLSGMLPINQWRDTFLLALYCGLPSKLEKIGKALNLEDDKKKLSIGGSLIRTFCVPRKPTKKDSRTRVLPHEAPDKWKMFKTYNIGDVVAEMAIEDALQPITVPDFIQEQWEHQILQNARGVAVDTELVYGALYINDLNREELLQEASELTGVDNPNSRDQLLKWLSEELGEHEVPNLTKATVTNLQKLDNPDHVHRVLEIRQEVGKAALKKYQAIDNMICPDSRVRGLLQFYGAARTGRWSGRGVQLQNLARTDVPHLDVARQLVKERNLSALRLCYGNVSDVLGMLVRTALIPTQGYSFVDVDFSAIEARVLAWLAGEEWVLEVFRTHGKIYEATASQMFNVPLELIKKGNEEYRYRQQGKTANLALGYQGSSGALTQMDFNNAIPDSEKPGLVKKWRKANPNIVKLWYAMEDAAMQTVITGKPHTVRYATFEMIDTPSLRFLVMRLPCGRHLSYADPRIGQGKFNKPALSYMGVENGQWARRDTYGGMLVENLTQAVARDILAEKMVELVKLGETAVFSVHDEVALEQLKGQEDLQRICDILAKPIPWAEGLPLNAAGWIGDYYTKD